MKNKNQNTMDRTLVEFLNGGDEFISADIDAIMTGGANPSSKKRDVGEIKDSSSLELLRYELDALYTHFFTQAQVCTSLLELFKEIETPNENSDIAELKKFVYSGLSWLEWNGEDLFAATHEGELKWLKQLVVKTIGRKPIQLKST